MSGSTRPLIEAVAIAPRTRAIAPLSIRVLAFLFTAIVGFWFAWTARYAISPDGVSYLDIARQVAYYGNWRALLNAHWSPGYPALVAAMLRVVAPQSTSELVAVHILNWLIFLVGLIFFLRFTAQVEKAVRLSVSAQLSTPRYCASCAFFLFVVNRCTPLSLVTPDLMVVVITCLVATLLLYPLRTRRLSAYRYTCVGLLLAVAYLIKAPLFPVSIAMLATQCVIYRGFYKKAFLALGVLLLAMAPFVIGLSRREGHFTAGESGSLNYLWWVDGLTPICGWPQGCWLPPWASNSTEKYGLRQHQPVVLSQQTGTWAFAYPRAVTYPPWYDPAYWYIGLKPQIEIRHHLVVIWNALLDFLRLLPQFAGLIAAITVLLVWGRSGRRDVWLTRWVIPWCSIGTALFIAIHMEARYVAPFILMSGAALLLDLALHNGRIGEIVLWAVSGLFALQVSHDVLRHLHTPKTPLTSCLANIHQGGLHSADQIATLGSGARAYFAHLAGLQIVAEVRDPDAFYALSDTARSDLLRKIHSAGAKAVVSVDDDCSVITNLQ